MKLLLFFALVCAVSAQLVVPGKCPNVPGVSNVEGEKFKGHWYFVKVSKGHPYEDVKCSNEHIKSYTDDKMVGEVSYLNATTNEKFVMPFTAKKVVGDNGVVLVANFNWQGVDIEDKYQILYVDYDNYFVTWQCVEKDGNSYRNAYVESRRKELSDEQFEKIAKLMDQYELGSSNLLNYDQTDCNLV